MIAPLKDGLRPLKRFGYFSNEIARASTNKKMKETVALELSFVNSNLQLSKEQLAELNSSVELYQMQNNSEVTMLRMADDYDNCNLNHSLPHF